MSFEAHYHGTCTACEGSIVPGDQVESAGNGYQHVTCPDPLALRAGERVCYRCFMVHRPGQTECE
jgi:hypothetical protein